MIRFALCLAILTCVGLTHAAPPPATAPTRPLVLAHYMPWFKSKPFSGAWGYHWTMGTSDPDRVLPDGRRQIAAHQYPLLGPYDSADPHLNECHVLLMKLAGIDGVIVDWYGNETRNDYAPINQATLALLREIERRGLKFAITYEDRVFVGMDRNKAVALARDAFAYADNTFFASPAYVRRDGRPLVLLFGPAFFDTAAQWDDVLAGLTPRPKTYALHAGGPADSGTFAWPPMSLTKDGVLAADALRTHFAKSHTGDAVPAAVVGFHDFYREAKVGPGYGYLDARDGETFRETLAAALKSGQPVVQLVTWNDFGEGTALEPTRAFGTRLLDTVRRLHCGSPLDDAAVEAALRVYAIRKTPAGLTARRMLDEVVRLLHLGDTTAAVRVLSTVSAGR